MAVYKNVASQKVAIYAYDSDAGAPKTGDAANITARLSKDAAVSAATNDANPTELSATHHPGIYVFDLTQAETNADMLVLSAVSATADVVIEPVILYALPGDNTALNAALADGAHGGSSAVMTLKQLVVDNDSGIAVDIDGTTGGLNVQASAGTGIVAVSGGGNGHGISSVGHGTGEGLSLSGGDSGKGIQVNDGMVITNASGTALVAVSAGGDGNGITATGNGAGEGLSLSGVTLGAYVGQAAVGPTKTEMDSAFTEIKGATWTTTDTLEAIRDRGDAAWATATNVTVSDKTGFILASTGLDQISAAEPSGKPTTFPGWIMWLVQRFRRSSKTPTTLTTQTEAGATITTQTITDDGSGTETLGSPS